MLWDALGEGLGHYMIAIVSDFEHFGAHPKSQCLLALDELVAVHGSLVKFQVRIRFFKAIEAEASTVSILEVFFVRKAEHFGRWSFVSDLHLPLFLSERHLSS